MKLTLKVITTILLSLLPAYTALKMFLVSAPLYFKYGKSFEGTLMTLQGSLMIFIIVCLIDWIILNAKYSRMIIEAIKGHINKDKEAYDLMDQYKDNDWHPIE